MLFPSNTLRWLQLFPPLFQSGRVRDAAWESDWVGAPVSFQRCIIILICVSKEFKLTAGKIIPVYQSTVMVVRSLTVVRIMDTFLFSPTNITPWAKQQPMLLSWRIWYRHTDIKILVVVHLQFQRIYIWFVF